MDQATHIIGTQRLRLRYHGAVKIPALQQLVSELCTTQLPAQLNELLDRYAGSDTVLRINRLSLNVSVTDAGDLQQTLVRAILEKIALALQEQVRAPTTTVLGADQSLARLLQLYLSQGYLPWWSTVKNIEDFRSAVAALLPQLVPGVIPLLSVSSARGRLIGLLDDRQLGAFVEAAAVWQADEWRAWLECFEVIKQSNSNTTSNAALNRIFRNAVLEVIGLQSPSNDATHHLAMRLGSNLAQQNLLPDGQVVDELPFKQIREAFSKAIVTQKAEAALTESQQQDQQTIMPDEGEYILIGNAGLVLVAFYLPAFFRNTGLLDEDGNLKDLPRAVALLRYLVFENEAFEEFEIVMEKLLCGWSLAGGIHTRRLLTDDEKEQADQLLQSVIGHWSALKNTSPAGLRHNFLQRSGRLRFRKGQCELTVQKEARDILLNYLPWSISMIMLPWMKHLLIVKWNQ